MSRANRSATKDGRRAMPSSRRAGTGSGWLAETDDRALAVLWLVVVLGTVALVIGFAPMFWPAASSEADSSALGTAIVSEAPSAPLVDPTPLPTEAPLAAIPAPAAAASSSKEQDVSSLLGLASGKVLEGSLHSDTLNMELGYRVYLPPGYGTSQERYPVVYLLHGNGGDFREWTDGGYIGSFAEEMQANGRIRPMIVFMPEGDHSYYMNHAGDGQRWGDYIAKDVVSYVDSKYRTIPDRAHRAIGGLSMGGTGALQLGFNHPDVYSVVVANSPSLHQSMEGVPYYFGDAAYYAAYDPLRLAQAIPSLGNLRIWIDAGADDGWLPGAQQLHEILASRGIAHEWHPYQGVHFTTYWIEHTVDYLGFYSDAFDRNDKRGAPAQ